jgi:2-methylisocitrate lyase-like PEP mutase family enzyme
MANQSELAETFAALHVQGDPLIIFNVWDAGTANEAKRFGAKAIATGSYAVAQANGFDDGEKLPFELALANLERIVANVDLPVSLDFEGGYATTPDQLRENTRLVINAGAIGINFEDRIVQGNGLYGIKEQAVRIRAIRDAADETDVALFINARCDVVLPLDTTTHNEGHLDQMTERAAAYAEAGASGFFAPGLVDPDFIEKLCSASPVPVNILVWPGVPSSGELANLGVARISYGGSSYRMTMDAFRQAGKTALEWRKEKAARGRPAAPGA